MSKGKSEIRDRILEAAMERISHYGYAKTTIAEIAADCKMSAGNIYRFFQSKLDIAEAMAHKFQAEVFQTMAGFARDAKSPAPQRLRDMLYQEMVRTYEALASDAKLLEVADVIRNERPAYINEELAQERVYITRILEDGVEQALFAPLDNVEFTAEMIQSAMVKFRFPQLWSRLELHELEREFHGVMDLLIAGLASKKS